METISTPSSVLASADNSNYFFGVMENNLSNLRKDVQEARLQACETECSIKDTIQRLQLEQTVNFKSLETNLCMVERHLHDNIVDVKIEGLKTEARTTDRLNAFERNVDHQFCAIKGEIKDSTRLILDRLTADKLDEKNDEIQELRFANRHKDHTLLFSNQLNELKSMINSVEQHQKFSSKTVQFGAGNVAIPTQTANQG